MFRWSLKWKFEITNIILLMIALHLEENYIVRLPYEKIRKDNVDSLNPAEPTIWSLIQQTWNLWLNLKVICLNKLGYISEVDFWKNTKQKTGPAMLLRNPRPSIFWHLFASFSIPQHLLANEYSWGKSEYLADEQTAPGRSSKPPNTIPCAALTGFKEGWSKNGLSRSDASGEAWPLTKGWDSWILRGLHTHKEILK